MSGVDSCYSWVVATASCLIFLLVSCPVRLGAQLFVSLLHHYDTTRKEASFPFVLSLIVRSISGPFAGVLGDRIGMQGVTIFGCLLCAVGVGGCFLAEDVLTINLCLGVIYGIGYGWSNALIPEILNHHFKKHRSRAYGIFLSGGGLGAFLFPPILDISLKQFGVSGTFLIMAAIILNSVPAAMLLTVHKSKAKSDKPLPSLHIKLSLKVKNGKQVNEFPADIAVKDIAISFKDICENASKTSNLPLDVKYDVQTNHEISKISLKNGEMEQAIGNHAIALENHVIALENHVTALENHVTAIKKTEKENRTNVILNEETKQNSICEFKTSQSLNVQQLRDKCYTANVKNIDLNLKEGSFNLSKKSLISTLSVLWSNEYLIVASVEAVVSFVGQVFWTITVDFVRDKGIEQYLEVYFVMSLSLFDTIGRLFLSSISDKGLMTITNFSVSCFVAIGFICVLLAWLTEFFSIMTIISLMGLTLGGVTIAMPAIITEFFVKKEKRSIAMASRLLLSAPICLTISPLIGFFRGSLRSYDGLLYVMTSMCVVCVILLLLLPVLKRRSNHVQMKGNK